jgi:hypothetical protein
MAWGSKDMVRLVHALNGEFKRHGANHDLYVVPGIDRPVSIPRHANRPRTPHQTVLDDASRPEGTRHPERPARRVTEGPGRGGSAWAIYGEGERMRPEARPAQPFDTYSVSAATL